MYIFNDILPIMRNAEHQENPFHQDKIWIHYPILEALARGEMTAPITAEIDLTDGACNQACRHCCFSSGEGLRFTQINPEKLLRSLEEMRNLGMKGVEFVGGGEPTAHKQVKEILEGALDLGLEVGLVTNGLLAHKILPIAHRLHFVRVSLDSANQETYDYMHGVRPGKNDFAKVINNIRALREAIPQNDQGKMQLGIGYLVVPPHNHAQTEVFAGAQLAQELAVDYIVYRPAQIQEGADLLMWNEAQNAISAARKIYGTGHTRVYGGGGIRWATLQEGQHPTGRCDAKPTVAIIQADGSIAHCNLWRNDKDSKIGNIYDDSFASQWFGERSMQLWRESQIDGCPNPCKIYTYTNVVRQVMDGQLVIPNQAEIGHLNHV